MIRYVMKVARQVSMLKCRRARATDGTQTEVLKYISKAPRCWRIRPPQDLGCASAPPSISGEDGIVLGACKGGLLLQTLWADINSMGKLTRLTPAVKRTPTRTESTDEMMIEIKMGAKSLQPKSILLMTAFRCARS